MKFQKGSELIDGWKSVDDAPPATKELYIVVQTLETGDRVRNAAYWEQDVNGDWGWNKPNISHWTKWPEMPKS